MNVQINSIQISEGLYKGDTMQYVNFEPEKQQPMKCPYFKMLNR